MTAEPLAKESVSDTWSMKWSTGHIQKYSGHVCIPSLVQGQMLMDAEKTYKHGLNKYCSHFALKFVLDLL